MAENLSTLFAHDADATLRGFIGYQLKRAYNTLRADLLHQLGTLDLRITTYSTLVIIVDNPGLSQSDLGTTLEIKRSNMVAIIDELESRGWVVRKQVATDRRAYALFPTRSGTRVCKKASALVNSRDEQLRRQLSATEIDQLTAILQKIETAVQE